MQHIEVNYFGDSKKNYIYKCKYRTIQVGNFVVVPVNNKNTVAKVVGVGLDIPQFQCKEVIRKVDTNV